MLEIPGEEAPTDPGLEARKRQQAETMLAHQRARKRNRFFVVIGVVALSAAGTAGWMHHKAAQEELVYDLGDVYLAPIQPAAPVVADAGTAKPDAKATKAGGSGSRKAPQIDFGANPTAMTSGPSGPDVVTSPGSGAPKYVPGSGPRSDLAVGTGGSSGPAASDLGGAEIQVKRLNTTVLETDEEIKAMAVEVTSAYMPQVSTCLEQKLKVDEAFKGGVKVSFTIQTDGSVSNVKTAALDEPDADYEACIVRAVGRWRYQRIAHEFRVQKKIQLR